VTLREQQSLFAQLAASLITYAYSAGYEITLGEAWRTPEQAQWNADNGSGIVHSLHTQRLAIDLNLFKDGALLETVDGYRPMGTYWKGLHELARWGGDFSKPDSDHFSLEFDGIQ
jgi:hypothetical protein